MLDLDMLHAAVSDREQLMGTGTGNEVAMPHARLEMLDKPVLVFGRSTAGIEWNAPDGLPVRLVFLLLTPEREEGLQLQILAALARGMSNDGARAQLLRAESEEQVWQALQDALRTQNLVRVKSGGLS